MLHDQLELNQLQWCNSSGEIGPGIIGMWKKVVRLQFAVHK